jgi:hypothetical protein
MQGLLLQVLLLLDDAVHEIADVALPRGIGIASIKTNALGFAPKAFDCRLAGRTATSRPA